MDLPVTRRKSYHVLVNPEGKVAFRARHISDVIRHLEILDVSEYQMLTDADPPLPSFIINCSHKEL